MAASSINTVLLGPAAAMLFHHIAFVDTCIVEQDSEWYRVRLIRARLKKAVTSSRVVGRC